MTRPAATFRLPDGHETYAGVVLRSTIRGTVTWENADDGLRRVCSRTTLSREYPATHPVWAWLRAHGVQRVVTSGPSGKVSPNPNRTSVPVTLRVSPATRLLLDGLASRWGCTRSEAVSRLVVGAAARP